MRSPRSGTCPACGHRFYKSRSKVVHLDYLRQYAHERCKVIAHQLEQDMLEERARLVATTDYMPLAKVAREQITFHQWHADDPEPMAALSVAAAGRGLRLSHLG